MSIAPGTAVELTLVTDGPAVTSPDQARDLVALHMAATFRSDATLVERESVRASWLAALRDLWDQAEDWAVVYLPGAFFHDNLTFAVHLGTGRVVGGDCEQTRLGYRESTKAWLERVAAPEGAPIKVR